MQDPEPVLIFLNSRIFVHILAHTRTYSYTLVRPASVYGPKTIASAPTVAGMVLKRKFRLFLRQFAGKKKKGGTGKKCKILYNLILP